MKQLLKLLFLTALSLPATAWGETVYSDSNVRFTVISDGAVRMEYAPDGKFVDSPTLMAIERDYPATNAKVTDKNGYVTVTTKDFELKYKKNSGDFNRRNLSVKCLRSDADFTWHPGDRQAANLKGTYRTLDGYDGEFQTYDGNKPMPIEDGLIARDGWTLLDDSGSLIFDDSEWPWVTENESDRNSRDWYLLVYGHDYRQALNDFTKFSGKVPLPPRYAFGYWWSRYWCYSDNELRQLVNDFKSHDIPLDVLVIDMDWHYTEAGKGGWTGYTWNRSLFPDPKAFLKFVKDSDLRITMNLHPADGIHPYEEKYADVVKLMGLDPSAGKKIPYDGSSKTAMKSWLDGIIHPLQEDGVDFWWLDWQQQQKDERYGSLDNIWWINYVFFSDMERNRTERPMLYHRWGGLGNHRYQIGFSGDAAITWNSLDFQPYFNATASNVLYGFWSHDIGGHHFGIGRIEPEMFVRWMQFGQYSPILRTHSTKNENLKKEPWSFENRYYRIIKGIIENRYAMAPYIYTMARQTHDCGVSVCRPMYYDYPECEEAYNCRNQYMFGDNMLVMPVTRPMEEGEFYSAADIWLPEGCRWYELATGTMFEGGRTVRRYFAIDETPVYVKAGSIIPMSPGQKNLRGNDFSYQLNIYPGDEGHFCIYEDNGNDKDYRNCFATTEVSSTFRNNVLTVNIEARKGSYDGMPSERKFTVKVNGFVPPQSVMVDGVAAESEYDGNTMSLCVDIPLLEASCPREIEIVYPDTEAYVPDGIIGQMRRVADAVNAVKNKKAGLLFREELAGLESAGRAISYKPEEYSAVIERFISDYGRLPEILMNHDLSDSERSELASQAGYGK